MMSFSLIDLFPSENAYNVLQDMKAVVLAFCEDHSLTIPSDRTLDTFTSQVVLASIGAIALDTDLKVIDDLLESRPRTPSISDFHATIEALYNSLEG